MYVSAKLELTTSAAKDLLIANEINALPMNVVVYFNGTTWAWVEAHTGVVSHAEFESPLESFIDYCKYDAISNPGD